MRQPARVSLGEPHVHETAVVHPSAQLGQRVAIGPFCVVGADVVLGEGCDLDSHVRLDGPLSAGRNNRFFHGSAIGGDPQDLKYAGATSRVHIGDDNVFREFVTVNRATNEGDETIIGNGNLLMAYVHVAHDCILHDRIILANTVNLAGHVEIEDCAIVGGLTPVHQFVKVGCYSIVGGASRLSKDMPPYMKCAGNPVRVVGLNTVGLERRGFPDAARRALKDAFRLLYRSSLNVSQAADKIRAAHPDVPEIEHLLEFIARSNRGIVR